VTATRVLLIPGGKDWGEAASALEEDGCRLLVADSVSEAERTLRDRAADIVVSEYELRDGDGLELLRRVRSGHDHLPFVLYTAHGDESVASDAIEAGVSAYIPASEPSATERLVVAVREHAVDRCRADGLEDIPEPGVDTLLQAIDEAPIGITIADPSVPDNPIVYLNEAYEAITGYDAEDVLGRNCRFLQGPDTSDEPVAAMREAVTNRESVSVELLNYREDGTPFWNQVDIAPLFDEHGDLTHFVGFQTDVTERKEAEATARQRADALREERQTLERVLGRVSGLINDTSRALVAAGDRAEIEQRVCEEIVDIEGYTHAWIGDPPAVDADITVNAAAGGGDVVALESDGGRELSGTLFEQARQQGTVVVSSGEEIPPTMAPEQFGATAVATVPLTYRRQDYGVLCVYADRSELLDRRECAILESLGRMIANGINAVETKQVLTADRVTELRFDIDDGSFPLCELATAAGGSVVYDGSTLVDDSTVRLFVSVSDPSEPVEPILEETEAVREGFVIARRKNTVAASVELEEPTPFADLAEYGATVRDLSVSATTGTAQLQVDLPPEGDVRTILSVLEAEYDGVDLVRQRERERSPQPTAKFTAAVADHLTDRQHTALETAYRSGYFEFPRPVSGEELAESMDISRQTYHQHLRTAQRKLLEAFFESD